MYNNDGISCMGKIKGMDIIYVYVYMYFEYC